MKLISHQDFHLFQIIFFFQDWTDLLSDGLHFSVQGNRFVAKQLVQLLDDMFKHLPKVFPDWKDIDPKNLEKYLPTSC